MGGIHSGRVAGEGSVRGSGIMGILGAGDMSIADPCPAELPPVLCSMGVTKGAQDLGEMSIRDAALRGVSFTDGGRECEWAVQVTLPS